MFVFRGEKACLQVPLILAWPYSEGLSDRHGAPGFQESAGLLGGMHFQWLLKKAPTEKVPWSKDPKEGRERAALQRGNSLRAREVVLGGPEEQPVGGGIARNPGLQESGAEWCKMGRRPGRQRAWGGRRAGGIWGEDFAPSTS